MKELNMLMLTEVAGGGDLPVSASSYGPSEAYLRSILALLTPTRTVHNAD